MKHVSQNTTQLPTRSHRYVLHTRRTY